MLNNHYKIENTMMFLSDFIYAKYFSDIVMSIFRQYLKDNEHYWKTFVKIEFQKLFKKVKCM